MIENEIIMLGTGNATVTKCYNTCFLLRSGQSLLLVDAGGGNGILTQLEKAGVALTSLHDLFLTHAHTDHILGAVWVVRMVLQKMRSGQFEGIFRVISHRRALNVLEQICRLTLPAGNMALLGSRLLFCEVHDGEAVSVGNMRLDCFDILSTKEPQYGFRASMSDGTTVACLGDEPFNEHDRTFVAHSDWLMCEAFCLYRDREVYKPYEKHHSTALDAGRLAAELGVGRLILYHTEDKNLRHRCEWYTAEAREHFRGPVFVPDDLERISLTR